MTRTKTVVTTFFVLLSILVLDLRVSACLCVPMSPKKRVKLMMHAADAIFTGRVKEVYGYGVINVREIKVILVVEKSWKSGNPSEYTIYTDTSGCGAFFEVGKEYLVFAGKDNGRQLRTDVCMGTRIISSAKKELRYLGRPVYDFTHIEKKSE